MSSSEHVADNLFKLIAQYLKSNQYAIASDCKFLYSLLKIYKHIGSENSFDMSWSDTDVYIIPHEKYRLIVLTTQSCYFLIQFIAQESFVGGSAHGYDKIYIYEYFREISDWWKKDNDIKNDMVPLSMYIEDHGTDYRPISDAIPENKYVDKPSLQYLLDHLDKKPFRILPLMIGVTNMSGGSFRIDPFECEQLSLYSRYKSFNNFIFYLNASIEFLIKNNNPSKKEEDE